MSELHGVESFLRSSKSGCQRRDAWHTEAHLYYIRNCVADGIGVAMLGVGLPALFAMASRGSSSFDSESCVGVGTIGLATLSSNTTPL
jgi:hypothetical protein